MGLMQEAARAHSAQHGYRAGGIDHFT